MNYDEFRTIDVLKVNGWKVNMPRSIPIDPALNKEAREWARRIIRVEMAKRDLSFGGLAGLLDEAGVHENERNLRNKVARGEFSAAFLLMCLKVMGCETISLSDLMQ